MTRSEAKVCSMPKCCRNCVPFRDVVLCSACGDSQEELTINVLQRAKLLTRCCLRQKRLQPFVGLDRTRSKLVAAFLGEAYTARFIASVDAQKALLERVGLWLGGRGWGKPRVLVVDNRLIRFGNIWVWLKI